MGFMQSVKISETWISYMRTWGWFITLVPSPDRPNTQTLLQYLMSSKKSHFLLMHVIHIEAQTWLDHFQHRQVEVLPTIQQYQVHWIGKDFERLHCITLPYLCEPRHTSLLQVFLCFTTLFWLQFSANNTSSSIIF